VIFFPLCIVLSLVASMQCWVIFFSLCTVEFVDLTSVKRERTMQSEKKIIEHCRRCNRSSVITYDYTDDPRVLKFQSPILQKLKQDTLKCTSPNLSPFLIIIYAPTTTVMTTKMAKITVTTFPSVGRNSEEVLLAGALGEVI
jgi:hypothetical protein